MTKTKEKLPDFKSGSVPSSKTFDTQRGCMSFGKVSWVIDTTGANVLLQVTHPNTLSVYYHYLGGNYEREYHRNNPTIERLYLGGTAYIASFLLMGRVGVVRNTLFRSSHHFSCSICCIAKLINYIVLT